MSDLYRLGQSKQGNLENVGQEIRLDINLIENPFLNTGSVTGTITDSDDNPVEGVLIKILDNNHNPLYHTLTDENGLYNISDIAPASELRFSAIKTGYILNDTVSFSLVAGQTMTMNAVITPDPKAQLSTVTVHLNDPLGNPLGGVTTTLLKDIGGEETPVAVTTTNEYGQAVFMKLELGSYIGRATKQGYDTAEIEIQVTQSGSITNIDGVMEISPTTSQGTINGTIEDEDGNPVIGAVVILYEVTGTALNPVLTPIRYTRTIDGGAYLFGDVPQGRYIVKANKDG